MISSSRRFQQPIEPIWGSAGIKFADEKGNVDFDAPAAVAITEKWAGMYTKDKSTQPTAVNDRYPQLFAVMEQGKCAMWLYGTHANFVAPSLAGVLFSTEVVVWVAIGGRNSLLGALLGGVLVASLSNYLSAIVPRYWQLALGVLFECHRASLDVPKQIGIVGFNDLDMMQVSFPSITSVRTHRYEIGTRAVAMALAAIAGNRPDQRIVDLGFELIRRESTAR